jgi:hypothetical protein
MGYNNQLGNNVTPNLGLILSQYDDQEHREYNNNWGILDQTIIVTVKQLENINTTQSLSLVTPVADTFYSCPIYLNSRGDGASPSTLTATVTWTGVSNVVHTATMVIDGTVPGQVAQEVFVILALGGTTVSIVTSFSSTAFHYDLAAKISLA